MKTHFRDNVSFPRISEFPHTVRPRKAGANVLVRADCASLDGTEAIASDVSDSMNPTQSLRIGVEAIEAKSSLCFGDGAVPVRAKGAVSLRKRAAI